MKKIIHDYSIKHFQDSDGCYLISKVTGEGYTGVKSELRLATDADWIVKDED